jgi:hypothetical protein
MDTSVTGHLLWHALIRGAEEFEKLTLFVKATTAVQL